MKPQMNRHQQIIVAEELLQCLNQETDVLQRVAKVYIRAIDYFDGRENDIDPTAVAIGLQAQYLGVRTLYKWLEALSKHTSTLYYLRGQEYLSAADLTLETLGIAVPDEMLL